MHQRSNTSFSKQLREVTRDIHKISDVLVNAKLAFALSDDKVWAEGLLIFYEIFKYLEEHVPEDLLPKEYHRKSAFENDLKYYLGSDWQIAYKPRESVQNYLKHLNDITKENSILLLAYVYHLYMGLLSGGQILQKKRLLVKRIKVIGDQKNDDNHIGSEVCYFSDLKISDLKKRMRCLVDEYAKGLDNNTKNALLKESRKVFELNNEIIRTVKGINKANFRKLFIFFVILLTIFLIYRNYFSFY